MELKKIKINKKRENSMEKEKRKKNKLHGFHVTN